MDKQTRENLIQGFGLQDMATEDQDNMIAELGGIIFQAAITRVGTTLPEDKQKELSVLFDTGAEPEKIMALLQSSVSNWNDIIEEETLALKGQIQEEMAKTQVVS